MLWLSCVISNVFLASCLALAAWHVQRLRLLSVARLLWVLVFVKLVAPPLVRVPLVQLPNTIPCRLGICDCPQHAGAATIVTHTLVWGLLAVWTAGAIARGWTAWRHWALFRRLVASAHSAPPEWQALLARLSAELAIRRPPEILAVPGRLPPLVAPGVRRPTMLIPQELMGQLTPLQRESLLLHELIHLKRGDHLVRILELAVSIAFWWLPILGLFSRQLRHCEETCCDAAVVARLPQGRHEYGQLLLDVVDFAHLSPVHNLPQTTAMSAAEGLEERLRAILGFTSATPRSWPSFALALGLACAVLPCELRYGFVKRSPTAPASVAVTNDTCDPTAAPAPFIASRPPRESFSSFCCPSE